MMETSRVAVQPVASRVVLSSIESVSAGHKLWSFFVTLIRNIVGCNKYLTSQAWTEHNRKYVKVYCWPTKLVPTFANRGVSHGQCNGSPRSLISVFYIGAGTYHSSSSTVILMRLSGPYSRPTTSQKIW
jgi:hypothetical protein